MSMCRNSRIQSPAADDCHIVMAERSSTSSMSTQKSKKTHLLAEYLSEHRSQNSLANVNESQCPPHDLIDAGMDRDGGQD